MPIFSGASTAVTLRLVCPHCGHVQARARAKELTQFFCKACAKAFSREEGERAARAKDAVRTSGK